METLFVSDVHLSAARPDIVSTFVGFLDGQARSADALYVLGDLFDEWLGDDDQRPPHPAVTAALAEFAATGVPLKIMRGNHDFLLGIAFESASGCELLDDPTVVDLYGTRALLMHGDTLCTRDTEYQAFRTMSRNPDNQREFLNLPLEARIQRAEAIRGQSKASMQLKTDEIMDVTPEAVLEVMAENKVSHLIHGHTHRPAVHPIAVGGESATRVVLGDWYAQDSVLRWTESGFSLGRLSDLRS